MVGTGIFTTPAQIIASTNSVGAALLLWALGGIVTLAGLYVFIELGTALPRSGGPLVYLPRIFRRPRYLATCIFAVQFVLFATSASSAVSFAANILQAGSIDRSGSYASNGLAVAIVTAVCLIHAFLPSHGVELSNILGVVKLGFLVAISVTGFVALGGRSNTPPPGNFIVFDGSGTVEVADALQGTPGSAAGFAVALLHILYSFFGWQNANYVLGEVRRPKRTLFKAVPITVGIVVVLYMLINVAYFAALSKNDIALTGIDQRSVAAAFFEAVVGNGSFVQIGVPILLATSALGNVFAQVFAMARVKQEIAKEGLLPWSLFWAREELFPATFWAVPRRWVDRLAFLFRNWTTRPSPTRAILLHWIITVVVILASTAADGARYVSVTFFYAESWVSLFLAAGLLSRFRHRNIEWLLDPVTEKSVFYKAPTLVVVFWALSLVFAVSAYFVPFRQFPTSAIPWYVVPTVGTGLLLVGATYWLLWATVRNRFGFYVRDRTLNHEGVVVTEHIRIEKPPERVEMIHSVGRIRRGYEIWTSL
ncbi:amino acid/polyamine transporter I [Lasiosphaeria miniovina]|uniref:Amino acid/polyamine transporter I n=1 Tax=Lasiosphaeria miniovina TaxID=1954250 RepID=A0AA40B3C0_9PEZI|nr:amino acid/polyamine transporter I [Lasiosphaeria miniovina]KAK0726929.1 amino acid/polyamine transporter I [Lasiosphaeria miniovina]